MIEAQALIAALHAYRKRLADAGHPLRAATVAQCIVIVKRSLQTLSKDGIDHGIDKEVS